MGCARAPPRSRSSGCPASAAAAAGRRHPPPAAHLHRVPAGCPQPVATCPCRRTIVRVCKCTEAATACMGRPSRAGSAARVRAAAPPMCVGPRPPAVTDSAETVKYRLPILWPCPIVRRVHHRLRWIVESWYRRGAVVFLAQRNDSAPPPQPQQPQSPSSQQPRPATPLPEGSVLATNCPADDYLGTLEKGLLGLEVGWGK